jgi:hypothetical protein
VFVQVLSGHLAKCKILIFMAIAIALPAQATTFNNASLSGTYSFLINLWTGDVNTKEFGLVGVMTFDGAGQGNGFYSETAAGGMITSGSLSLNYAVNSNGTGTITCTTGLTNVFAITLNSTIARVAHGIQLLQTSDSANEVVSGTAVWLSSGAKSYSVSSLKGNFAFQGNEWLATAKDPEEGFIGVLTFDGKGNVTGTYTDMSNGQLTSPTLSGTYTVNADGFGGMLFLADNIEFTFALNSATASGAAKGFQFVVDNANGFDLVRGGSALKQ